MRFAGIAVGNERDLRPDEMLDLEAGIRASHAAEVAQKQKRGHDQNQRDRDLAGDQRLAPREARAAEARLLLFENQRQLWFAWR